MTTRLSLEKLGAVYSGGIPNSASSGTMTDHLKRSITESLNVDPSEVAPRSRYAQLATADFRQLLSLTDEGPSVAINFHPITVMLSLVARREWRVPLFWDIGNRNVSYRRTQAIRTSVFEER